MLQHVHKIWVFAKHTWLYQGNSVLFLLQFPGQLLQPCIVFSLLTSVCVLNPDAAFFIFYFSQVLFEFFFSFFFLFWTGAGGLSFLQFCNLNSFRTKFVLGFSIFMGLSIPQYFNEYTARNGYGPVHTRARWVFPVNPSCSLTVNYLTWIKGAFGTWEKKEKGEENNLPLFGLYYDRKMQEI